MKRTWKPLEPDEILYIRQLIEEGKSTKEIEAITGRSANTVQRIRNDVNGRVELAEKSENTDTAKWLKKNWCWKVPKEQLVKRKSSNFRTPYKNCRPY